MWSEYNIYHALLQWDIMTESEKHILFDMFQHFALGNTVYNNEKIFPQDLFSKQKLQNYYNI